MRFQFPLYKMFLMIAAWAVTLRVFLQPGIVGMVMAALIGVEVSLLIVSIRDRKALVSAVFAAMGSLIGAGFAFILLSPVLIHRYDFTDLTRDGIIVTFGAILGGELFSWASKR